MSKKFVLILSMVSVLLFCQMGLVYGGVPEITAKSAIVIDATTGRVLYAKNAEQRHYPASTTKIMTLIIALEKGNLNGTVTASKNAASTEGSSLSLSAGEQLKLLDLLYGMMLISGNDATVDVAENIAGSVPNFARLMTEKAHAIGAVNTNFVNSSGLPDPNHYTTAHDLARIAAYGYTNVPMFAQIVSTKHKIIPWAGKDHDRDLYNENKMLWLYNGANGVKTGYTEVAGPCLVSAAKRDNLQLIAVVLDSDQMWDDSIALLNYGFSQVKPLTLLNKGDIMKTIRVDNGKSTVLSLAADASLTVPVSDGDKDQYHTVIEAPEHIAAPVTAGEKIGVVKTMYKDREVASTDLVATRSVEKKSFFNLFWGSLWSVLTFFIRNFA
ncbi:peptidase s11 d-alanyl-d-alanine carboxypeptidase a [Lucifera butyrica]|uniref:serine-type D-Ala-D-Ala carboxypeptidase n=1 Tax=Lucifera butyrica TaxID=1351585 RepID=A0A498R9B3_9FIRM|nr:D-alanyl-D-alanine carboxypeptidase family protein [Lucifera butyrica]VBB07971.1 peptidase s11 d-alanyl-d-alanine carboxypeptidase a [Lucifera butyrica]